MVGYAFFVAVFVSSPLISEVFTYFLHNGIAIGYLSCGISLCFMREWQCSMQNPGKGTTIGEKCRDLAVGKIVCAAVYLWIAVGCYESFMILWLAGLLLLLLAERICMEAVHEAGVIVVLAAGATAAFLAVILRSLMIVIVTKAFHLEYLQ